MANQCNPTLFYKLIHGMIRASSDPGEETRARGVITWLNKNSAAIAAVCDDKELHLIRVIWQHWLAYKQAPSRHVLEDLVRLEDKPEAMLSMLSEYDTLSAAFPRIDATDAASVFKQRENDWRTVAFADALRKAARICESGIEAERKGDKPLAGINDARRYLFEQIRSGAIGSGSGFNGGSIAEIASDVVSTYKANKEAARNNRLFIPTGVPCFDKALQGLGYGTVSFILGGSGQRKSALARTMAYNAARAGFRVLFIPMEIHYKEELSIFAMMHSQDQSYIGTSDMSIARYNANGLNEEEESFLDDLSVDMRSDFDNRLLIKGLSDKDRTWTNTRTMIEMECSLDRLDLIVIDGPCLWSFPGSRDKVEAMNDAILEMKAVAMTCNGEGMPGAAIVAPMQGSRKGKEDAANNNGEWDKGGIYMYSEAEKTADTVFYTYLDPALQTQGMLKVGTCKTRRFVDVPCQVVPIDLNCGLVGREPRKTAMGEVPETAAAVPVTGQKQPEIEVYLRDRT